MIINTWRDHYEVGTSTTRPTKIELHPGLTVLVGCNGAGKTTLINNIKEESENNHIPVHLYDNLADGGYSNLLGSVLAGFKNMECDSLELGISMWQSSEGERIRANIARQTYIYKKFFERGIVEYRSPLIGVFGKKGEEEECSTNIRVLLFDATDSGVSIDSICEIKDFFHSLISFAEESGIELYIIISANEYELCRGEQCFDVNLGKYRTFKGYESYRKFILKSRERKEKRLMKQDEFWKKEQAKKKAEFEKFKTSSLAKIEKIKKKAQKEGRVLKWSEEYEIRRINDAIERKDIYN